MIKRRTVEFFGIVVFSLFIIGCLWYRENATLFHKASTSKIQKSKIQIAASFYPLYFFASQIAGDKANVINITPAGTEPHDYEPTPLDMARIEHSSLLILNGGKLEAWGDKVKDALKDKNIMIMTIAEDGITGSLSDQGEAAKDPHFWLSPPLAKKLVEVILSGLIKIDPMNQAVYIANAKTLHNTLDALDARYQQGLRNCRKKNIITSHAAFGYVAQTYGFTQIAISGLSPDEEPSSKTLVDIAKFARENSIRYIFFEKLISPKISETIAHEIGAQTLVLDPIEGMSEYDVKQGKNYVTAMDDNLVNLRKALECE
ncbi:hypothetical protein A2Z00_05000 [Candidatus Gottesmanbacteria bacterium RBG_13_45_10]|uniref:ABC transporter substrate-binding protein n=1 Tax=Candidatus Gottesmanbacteria bacterium RBG_13_45_10 TaxID=1798370 RepID=A0A1F5ZGY6_9BACT|nr:MAG: hypothetical protein A2Z00_05000 [Candidatus Gottesmanbacteria bacterium RBG_13_45_10]